MISDPLLGFIYGTYAVINLVRHYGYQMPQRYINSQLLEAEHYHTDKLQEGLEWVVKGLKGEKLAQASALAVLPKLTDALVLRARADFHVNTGLWKPESAEMLLAFCDEHNRIAEKPDLLLPSPNEAGRDDESPKPAPQADLTPQQRVAAMLRGTLPPPSTAEAAARATTDAGVLLARAREYRNLFDRMRDLMEEYFVLRHEERAEKAKRKSRWSPERREFRARRNVVKFELQACQDAICKVDGAMNPPKVLKQIARHIKNSYDLKIPDAAKHPSIVAAVEECSTVCEQIYAVVHKRWDKAVFSRYDKTMPLRSFSPSDPGITSVTQRIPRWTKMRKTGRSLDNNLTRIGTPTELMEQKIAKIMGQIGRTEVINLVMQLEKEVNALKGEVARLGSKQMLQLDEMIDAINAVRNESNESENQEFQASLARLREVLKQVRGKP